MATIYEVSELAGVSLATVSRVINGNAKVSDKTKEKVTSAMNELGYRPNSIAQSLASSTSNSVGVLVSELHGPFFGQMMSGIESELRHQGKHVIITTGHLEEKREKDGIDFLLSRNCDALILHVEAVSDEYLIQLSKGKVPIVIINRFIEELADNCIHLNNELGGYLATQSMIEMGHKSIAYISGPTSKLDSNQRLEGHKRALQDAGLNYNEELVTVGDFQQSGGSYGITELFTKNIPFSAVVCGNDEMASGAMATARAHNKQLPDDLSIIGFDNIVYSGYLYPTLTTIDYPINKMGHMAAQHILKHVYGKKGLEINNYFEPQLVVRDSMQKVS